MKISRSHLSGVCAAFCLVAGVQQVHAQPTLPVADQLSLSVSAATEVSNDVLVITFSTQREAADAATVQAQLSTALNAALTEARKVERPGQVDISTGSFSVQPRWAAKGEPTKWQGVAELKAEGKDFDALTRLVGRIQTLTVAQVGYRLSREARDKVQGEVSAQAIARFRSQAEGYARAFGFTAVTIRAVEVSTSDASAPPMMRMRAASADMAVAGAPLPVAAGKSEVSVVVSGSVQMK